MEKVNKHRSSGLDELIGKNTLITFKDGTTAKGILGFADTFSQEHGYRRPNLYYVGNIPFRKTHIKNAEKIDF